MRDRAPFPAGAVGIVVACKVALGAAVLGRYGWQRDEIGRASCRERVYGTV